MKPAPFAYVRPGTLDDAVRELAAAGGDGKVLGGGQSLVPILAMRLGRPAVLVDVGSLRALATIESTALDGRPVVRVGAATRQRQLERSHTARAVPLLGMALPFVGHRELRSRGTVCGSLAHADPAAELPAVAVCLGATLHLAGSGGRRQVPARGFFLGVMTTAAEPDEIVEAVSFPVAAAGEGFGFDELARRHGDFALAGVATRVRRAGDRVAEAVVAGFGVSDRPVLRDVTGLVGDAVDARDLEPALREGMSAVAGEMVDTAGDQHGSRDYRRRVFSVLAARELARALDAARAA